MERGREDTTARSAPGRQAALAASLLGVAAALAVALLYLGDTPPLARGVLLGAMLVLLVVSSLASGVAVVLAGRRRRGEDGARPEAGMPLARFLVIGPGILLAWGVGLLPSPHGLAPAMAAGEFAALAFAANTACDWIALRRLRR